MASEFVGGALLSSFLDDALDRLDSDDDILDYFREKKLDVKLLHKLKYQLMSINVVMDDAENKHYTDKNVSRWLRNIKDVVFDADDLLDEINTEVSMSKQMHAESQTVTSSSEVRSPNFTSTSSLSSFDEKLPSRIQDILDNLDDLASQKDILGLVKGTGVGVGMGKNVPRTVPTTSLVDEAAICGRGDDKKVIIDLLLSEDDNGRSGNNLAVISIVGMGKTTLAQLVYNDTNMKDEFQLKAWVCVSEDFDIVRVTKTILKELKCPIDDSEELNSLEVKLKEKLSEKKFLLVLDDVWEENHLKLEKLRFPFVHGARGSKILVTTRSTKVALAMRSAHPHQLKQLPEDQSWLLFAKYALCDSNSTSSFEHIGRKIIQKCNGVPLALKAIGALLYHKSTTEEWNGILTSDIWDISGDIIPALRLSYQYLPPLLKRCFAYCSLIPKDYEFDKDMVVELWMAENFLKVHQQKKGMKELGDQFFNDLLLRSFFQKSSRAEMLFVMHDLVNDLATSISREFCTRIEKEEDIKYVSKMTRHISFSGNYWENPKQFEVIYKANKLRTVLTFKTFMQKRNSSGIVDDLLSQCKCLRVLSLHVNFDIFYGFLDSIGYLKHLRYLDLSTRLKKLPASICLVYNLQTLHLVNCDLLEELPPLGIMPSLKKLAINGNDKIKTIGSEFYGNDSFGVPFGSLQFLEFGRMRGWEEWDCQNASGAFPYLVELRLSFCHRLKNKLPEHLPSLLNLKIEYCNQLVGSHPCAPTIHKIDVKKCGNLQLEFPVSNTCLETLKVQHCPNVEFQIRHPLNFLPKLKLIDSWDTLESLPLDLFPKVQTLNLWSCSNLKRLDGSVTSVIVLDIRDCPELVSFSEDMHTLFPSLAQFILSHCPALEFQIRHPLNFLRKLELTASWDTLKALPLDLFPNVQTLYLQECINLERLDVSITSLKSLEIHYCPKLVSFLEDTRTLFPSLTQLSLGSFPEQEWPAGGLPSSLEILDISDCPKLVASQMEWDLHNYTSLTELSIRDRNHEMVDYKGSLPPNLKRLNGREVGRPSS